MPLNCCALAVTRRVAPVTVSTNDDANHITPSSMCYGISDWISLERMGLDDIPAHAARSRAAAPAQDGMMTSGRHHILAALLLAALWLGWAGDACAVEVEFAGRPVKRDILALYDGRYESRPHLTRIHRFAEMPLNWLGFHTDLSRHPATAPDDRRDSSAIAAFCPGSWSRCAMPIRSRAGSTGRRRRPLRYVVDRRDRARRRPDGDTDAAADIRPAGHRIHRRQRRSRLSRARVVAKDDVMLGFERPLDRILTAFPFLKVKPERATSHSGCPLQRHGKTITSDVIMTSAEGRLSRLRFHHFYETTTDRSRWIVDPFLFFTPRLRR